MGSTQGAATLERASYRFSGVPSDNNLEAGKGFLLMIGAFFHYTENQRIKTLIKPAYCFLLEFIIEGSLRVRGEIQAVFISVYYSTWEEETRWKGSVCYPFEGVGRE
jgi:hypothetical protein